MTSDRIYRSALDPEQAFAELQRFSGAQFDPAIVEAFVGIGKSLLPPAPPDDHPSGTADPAAVFSSVVACLLSRFGQFAGEQVVGTIVHRLTGQGARQGWGVQLRDGELDVQASERQAALEARRQVLTWLLLGIEQLGGARIALHLLTEAVEQLSPQEREVYRVLLSPTRLEETAGSPQGEATRSALL